MSASNNFDVVEDEEVEEAVERLMETLSSEAVSKQELRQAVNEVTDFREEELEAILQQRDEYRQFMIDLSGTLEHYLDENEQELNDLESELREFQVRLEGMDLSGARDDKTYGYGVFNYLDEKWNDYRNKNRDANEEIDTERRGYIRDVLIGLGGIGGIGGIAYLFDRREDDPEHDPTAPVDQEPTDRPDRERRDYLYDAGEYELEELEEIGCFSQQDETDIRDLLDDNQYDTSDVYVKVNRGDSESTDLIFVHEDDGRFGSINAYLDCEVR